MTYAPKISRLVFFIFLSFISFQAWSEEGKNPNSDKVNLDEIKIKLVSKGSILGKKIQGPKKQQLRLKMMAGADTLKVTPESLGWDNADIINLGQPKPDELVSNKIK